MYNLHWLYNATVQYDNSRDSSYMPDNNPVWRKYVAEFTKKPLLSCDSTCDLWSCTEHCTVYYTCTYISSD
jgi:hypothetical protein